MPGAGSDDDEEIIVIGMALVMAMVAHTYMATGLAVALTSITGRDDDDMVPVAAASLAERQAVTRDVMLHAEGPIARALLLRAPYTSQSPEYNEPTVAARTHRHSAYNIPYS